MEPRPYPVRLRLIQIEGLSSHWTQNRPFQRRLETEVVCFYSPGRGPFWAKIYLHDHYLMFKKV